jgi:hypothetical protein
MAPIGATISQLSRMSGQYSSRRARPWKLA